MAPKKKQEKMSLGDFLGDQSLGSWADEMDSQPLPPPTFGSRGGASSGGFGAGGFGAGGFGAGGFGDRSSSGFGSGGFGDRPRSNFSRETLPLPDKPPYTAHLGNLSFDVTEGDIRDFLSGCEVTSVRIVEDKMDMRPKGFGYVEFGTLEGLKKALTLSETQFQGRNIRISVAEPPKERADARELNDWTRKGPLPDLPGQGMRRGSDRGGFNRGYDAGSDAGSDRGGRKPFFENDNKVRDFGNWERKGPLSPVPGAAAPFREGGRPRDGPRDGPRERRLSPAWGEGTGRGSESGSRPPRREFQERPSQERVPTAAEQDNQWRSRMKPDAPSPSATPDASTPTSPTAAAPAAPATRPRLNLAKRTVSEAPTGGANTASSDSKSSPFGAARPIDTTAREKEIAEKRELAIRQKKEADDKAREEKKAKEAAAKAEKKDAPAAPKENGKGGESKGEEGKGAQYEILRREENEEAAEDADAVDANANGDIVDDKSVKPQEVVREVPKAGDTWRKPSQPETTAESLEEDGWSTVPGKNKNGRRGGNRAMAS